MGTKLHKTTLSIDLLLFVTQAGSPSFKEQSCLRNPRSGAQNSDNCCQVNWQGPCAFHVALEVISTKFFFPCNFYLRVKSVHKRRDLLFVSRLCSLYLKLSTERTEAFSPCSLQYVASHFVVCPPSASPSPAKYRGLCGNHQATDAALRA